MTPRPTANRPGLPALTYRVGTHATFLEAMKAALSSQGRPRLRDLTTRETRDPAIAVLDAWATVADVLTFYQERLANEGYLRTATERRSILELARLVGYALRPGVAASAYLAYSLEKDSEVTIPAGSRSQSVPGPGELPQSFETSEDLEARAPWNSLAVRLTQPQQITADNVPEVLYFKGISTNLKPNDPLLVVIPGDPKPTLRRVAEVAVDPPLDRTKVILLPSRRGQSSEEDPSPLPEDQSPGGQPVPGRGVTWSPILPLSHLNTLKLPLTRPPSLPPRSAAHLIRNPAVLLGVEADTLPKLLMEMHPEMRSTLYKALQGAKLAPAPTVEVYALRTQAPLFGHNAPLRPFILGSGGRVLQEPGEWTLTRDGPTSAVELEIDLLVGRFHDGQPITTSGTIGGRSFRGQGDTTEIALKLGTLELGTLSIHDAQPLRVTYTFRESGLIVHIGLTGENHVVAESGPGWTVAFSERTVIVEQNSTRIRVRGQAARPSTSVPTETADRVSLDRTYPRILRGSWVLVDRPSLAGDEPPGGEEGDGRTRVVAKVAQVSERSRADYGITGRSTELVLENMNWFPPTTAPFAVIRGTTVLAESERLELAEGPIPDEVADGRIELAELYGGLEPGRWLIVAGERTDVQGTSGVSGAELVMLAGIEHGVRMLPAIDDVSGEAGRSSIPGDKVHSFLTLSAPLAYRYKRDTVRIWANVVRATHGETTRAEVVGSGDGSSAFQTFTLKQSPLTYVSGANAAGALSTLEVRVNDVRWHETEMLAGLGPRDRRFLVRVDDDGKTRLAFGNGYEGARPPTGTENVRATYRIGIGQAGNVKANQITLLATRPLGVKEVVNPQPASGGADRESRDEARENVPRALLALDRLVSVQDYADFACTFAGIGKAISARLSDGRRHVVHLTIAGADDTPITPSSDLYRNLLLALSQFGDPSVPVQVDMRSLKLLFVQARVCVQPEYRWESVEAGVRGALLQAFSFESRDLGQDVVASEVISAIQSVPGVAYVDLDALGALSKEFDEDHLRTLTGSRGEARDAEEGAADGRQPQERIGAALAARRDNGTIAPAELIVLSPSVPEMLLLSEITG